jgi:NTE family protein
MATVKPMSSGKTRVAIACQGGGSETAFTAGVLKALVEKKDKLLDHFTIVSASGTSGGALCAFFLWYAAKKGDENLSKRLIDFWEDNCAQTPAERMFNDSLIKMLKMTSQGLIPTFSSSPSSPLNKMMLPLVTQGQRSRYSNFRELLETHVDFSELAAWGVQPKPPILMLGACNILTGRLHQFSSYEEPIRVEHLLASACVPSIFPAVTLDGMAYWDGLFSDNPPIGELFKGGRIGMENIPQELWVIKINPTTSDKIPVQPSEIADRRNQLEGNISLFQNLGQMEQINYMMSRGAFADEYMERANIREPFKIPKSFPDDPDRPWHIPMIEISDELAKTLIYEDKLDRAPEKIHRLIADGEKQGHKFVEARLKMLAQAGKAG